MGPVVTVAFLGNTRDLEGATASARRLMQSFDGDLDVLANRMDRAGRAMTRGLTLPLVAGFGAAVSAAASFDSALNQSTAIMGDVSTAMREDMADAAREVSRTTTYSANEAAEAYYFLASAGLDAAASVEAMPVVARFAQAGMFDLAKATDLATDAQSALGLTSDDTTENLAGLTRTTDVLVKANTLANASVEQFSTALTNKAGAALRSANKDVEEGVAVLAAFADQGLKGEAAGTSLATVMQMLARQAGTNADAFEDLGIEFLDGQGNLRNMADIVASFEDNLDGMSDSQRVATLTQLGLTKQSGDAITTLLGTSDAIRDYEAELRNAGGTTEEVADKQMQTLSARLEVAKNQAINGAAAFGEVLVPAVTTMADVFANVAGAVSELPAGLTTTAVAIGAVAAAAGPMLTVGAKLVRLYSGLKGTATVLGLMAAQTGSWTGALGALGAGLGPAAPVIIGIGALAAALWAGKSALDRIDAQTTTTAEAFDVFAGAMDSSAGDVEQSIAELSRSVRRELRAMTPDEAEAYVLQIGHDLVETGGMTPDEAIVHLERVWADAFGDELELRINADDLVDAAELLDAVRVNTQRWADEFAAQRAAFELSDLVGDLADWRDVQQDIVADGRRLATTFASGDIAGWAAQYAAVEDVLRSVGLNGSDLEQVLDRLADAFAEQADLSGYNADGFDTLDTILADLTGTASGLEAGTRDLLREALDLADAEGITLADALTEVEGRHRDAAEAVDANAGAADDAAAAVGELADESANAAEQADEAASAHQRWSDKLRAEVDPVFAVTRAQLDHADALAELDEVKGDNEATSRELADAERRVAETAVTLRARLGDVVDEQGNVKLSAQDAREALEDMGAPPAVIDRILDDLADVYEAAEDVDESDPYILPEVEARAAHRGLDSLAEKADRVDRQRVDIATDTDDDAYAELGRLGARIDTINGRRVFVSTSGGRFLEGTGGRSHDGDVITPSMPGRWPGTAPDERWRKLRVGEEVLTADDPRHRNNMRGDGAGPTVVRGGDTYNIEVHQAPGTDTRELVAELTWALKARR